MADPAGASDDALANRAFWDATADEYQAAHGEFIGGPEAGWGSFQVPEHELQVLGDVAGKDVVELGCGAAQWSIVLARRGARPIGVDNSARQLEHARRLMAEAGVDFQLVHASAESVPLPTSSFDVAFCDHGALSWADPYAVVPEAARLLRPGGLLAFAITSPIASLCWHPETDVIEPQLHRSYFGPRRQEHRDGSVNYQLTYSAWVRLLRDNGFVVEDLLEPRRPEGATSTYWEPREWSWAERWPSDSIWKARKRA